MAIASVHHGKITNLGATGFRKKNIEIPIGLHDKFHIGSCTKSMTSVLAAILVREGKLSWDTTVPDVFPDIEIHTDYKRATLRQYLSNNAGCPTKVPKALWSVLFVSTEDPEAQRLRLLEGILTEPPRYTPGDGYEFPMPVSRLPER